jgi:hypothetical protein
MPTQPLKAASQNTEALAIGISATPSSSRRYTLDSYFALSLFRTLNTNSSPEKASDTVLAHERLAKVSIDISMNDVAPYTYQLLDDPEDQIRLFKYKRIDGAIHCEISAFDALETPPYKTLSYVWGPPYPISTSSSTAGDCQSGRTCSPGSKKMGCILVNTSATKATLQGERTYFNRSMRRTGRRMSIGCGSTKSASERINPGAGT